jgi:phosphoribosylglycinamide formyltransferase-1
MKAENPRSYCIYCSEGASRVLKFFSSQDNLKKYYPVKIIYDGERSNVQQKLLEFFGEDLILFNKNHNQFDLKRVHGSTSRFIHSVLDEFSIDYLICFGDKILKKELIDAYPNRLINFHPAILPAFKGLMAINQALDYGTAFLGNTAHYIDEGIDTGKIILQSAMLRSEFEDYEDVLEMQFPMLKMVLRDILNYNISKEELLIDIKDRTKQIFIPENCIV